MSDKAPRYLFAVKNWRTRSAENLADSARHTFYLTLSGQSRLTETWTEGGPRYAGREQPGTVTYIPPFRQRFSAYADVDSRFLTLRVDPGWLARQIPEPMAWRPFTNEPRPEMSRALRRLAETDGAILRDPLAGADIVLGLVALLDAETAQNLSSVSLVSFDVRLIRRIEDWIEAHLAGGIELDDLASLAGLSPWQFSRRFRAALGVSPYRFVTHVRLRRAKAMLTEGGLPIARIAAATGFHDQAHLTNTFRRFTGVTPMAYRG
jgi:AraC family transcriptional regulator